MEEFNSRRDNILCIDQGTTSTRLAVINSTLKIIFLEQIEHDQIHPSKGQTEHDPMQIYLNVKLLVEKLYHKKRELIATIRTISITNQRETCLAWDKTTGENLTNAIVWHDTRTIEVVEEIINREGNKQLGIDCYREICGLPVNTYFSAVKMKWIIDNVDLVKEKVKEESGKEKLQTICFGTIDSWLIFKLTGNHYTDVTNASRTMLMNLKTLDWDDYLLNEFDIPKWMLPTILNSSDNFGVVQEGPLKGIPITGVIGDQQAACVGHVLKEGEVKNTYGTGGFILMDTGEKIVHSKHGLLTTVLYSGNQNKMKSPQYALEGAIETAGSVLDWLKNNLHLFSDYEMLPVLHKSVENSGGVTFVPAFSGLFSPHWDSSARGLIIGLSHHTNRGHILHAAYEAISLRTFEVIQSFENESGIKVGCLKVDGGLTVSQEFLQTQSNVLGKNIKLEKQIEKEITIIGAAIVSGFEKDIAFWKDFDELRRFVHVDKIFTCEWSEEYFNKLYKNWNLAVEKAKNWLQI